MELKHYFDSHQGLGILSTADNQGPLAATDHEQACGQADHNRECRFPLHATPLHRWCGQGVRGVRLPFRSTQFNPGRRGCWPEAGIAATGHRVEPLGAHRCRVVFEVPLLTAPYLAVCQLAARRIRQILEEESYAPQKS